MTLLKLLLLIAFDLPLIILFSEFVCSRFQTKHVSCRLTIWKLSPTYHIATIGSYINHDIMPTVGSDNPDIGLNSVHSKDLIFPIAAESAPIAIQSNKRWKTYLAWPKIKL